MNAELPQEEKQPYSDSRCGIDVGRLQKSKSDRERLIIVKTVVNNFVINCEHAIQFLEEITEWQNILNMTLLLSYKVPVGDRDKFCQMAMESRKVCQFPEDKNKLEMFLEYEFKEKEKEENKDPHVHEDLQVGEGNKFTDV